MAISTILALSLIGASVLIPTIWYLCKNKKNNTVQEPIPVPQEPTIEEPVEQPTEQPTEEPIEEPTQEPIETPVEEPIEEPIEEPVEQPIEPEPQQPEPPTEEVPTPEEPVIERKLLYKVGLISDIHYDIYDNKGSQYKEDIKNALDFFKKEGVDCIMSCGDICNYQDEDLQGFYKLYKPYFDKGMRFYTCLGNHDYMRLYEGGVNKENLWQTNVASLHCIPGATENIEKDIHFFEYGAKWNAPQRTGTRNAHSKQNFWFEKEGDIYVFISVDYKESNGNVNGLSQAINLLDKTNPYVSQIKKYVKDTPYNESKEKNFDYRFYDPEVLIWLKDILEANTDKKVFVFSHHFFPHKAGNGNSLNNKWFYSQLRVWPYTTNTAVNARYYAGSNTLCGIEFWFLNKLNNTHKNSCWFSGHSHIQIADNIYQKDITFCNSDYEVVQPDGKETTPLVDDIWTLRGGPNDYKRYTRKNDTPINTCGLNIHLSSLSKPLTISSTTAQTLYKASEGMIMEVYNDGVKFKPIVFKRDTDNTYIDDIKEGSE